MDDRAKGGAAPGYTRELGRRIAQAIEAAGGPMAASQALDRDVDTLIGWRDGTAAIALHDVCALAEAAHVNRVWLAFGDDETARPSATVPIEAIRETWDFWMPVILRLQDRPDPATMRTQFLADVLERAARLR